MATSPLIGAWKLVSFQVRDGEGTLSYPFGQDAVGFYLITETGYASVAIMKANRPTFASGDILGGSAEEFVEAGKGYISYAGRYEVREDQLVVHPEVASFPNWVGVDQVRFISFESGRLILSARPILVSGRLQTPQLVWERVG